MYTIDHTKFDRIIHDPKDPCPWLALYLDRSMPLDEGAKAALLTTMSSPSRQYLLPFARVIGRAAIVLIQVWKTFVPRWFTSSPFLHKLIYRGLKTYVQPEANYLILRHFHLGSEVLQFIANNAGVDIPMSPLRPRTLEELEDDLFLKHDLNLYNFVIRLNEALREQNTTLRPPAELDFDCITDGGMGIEDLPNEATNKIDLETAIELYTPMYQLFLTDSDFWRATNSLQLDETIALYVATLMPEATPYLGLVNNKHPLVPESTLAAGHRLVLHGLGTEILHGILVRKKREQSARRQAVLERKSQDDARVDNRAPGAGAVGVAS